MLWKALWVILGLSALYLVVFFIYTADEDKQAIVHYERVIIVGRIWIVLAVFAVILFLTSLVGVFVCTVLQGKLSHDNEPTVTLLSEKTEQSTEVWNLISVEDKFVTQGEGSISGSKNYFSGEFLVCEEDYLFYYYETENGGYRQGKILAEDVEIHEESNCTNPRLVETSEDIERVYDLKYDKHKNKLARMVGAAEGEDRQVTKTDYGDTSYEIYIPEGSIVRAYKIDLE